MKILNMYCDSGLQESGRLTSEQVEFCALDRSVMLHGQLEVSGLRGWYRVRVLGEELIYYEAGDDLVRLELDPGEVIWKVQDMFSEMANENFNRFLKDGVAVREVGSVNGKPLSVNLADLGNADLVDFLRLEERGLSVCLVDDVLEVGSAQASIQVDAKGFDVPLLALSHGKAAVFDGDDVEVMTRVASHCIELAEHARGNIAMLGNIER